MALLKTAVTAAPITIAVEAADRDRCRSQLA